MQLSGNKLKITMFSFEFVKASGTEILPVNFTEGQEITGKILKHTSFTRPVYFRNVEVTVRSIYYICCPEIRENNFGKLASAKPNALI